MQRTLMQMSDDLEARGVEVVRCEDDPDKWTFHGGAEYDGWGTAVRAAWERHKTNDQFVEELMTFSSVGALMQLFILNAIEKYADLCIEAGPAAVDTPLVSGEAWVRAAKEAKERLDQHLKPRA